MIFWAAPAQVPNTDTFSLQDVFTELGLSANGTNGLVQCFAAADPAQFDPAYEGSKNSLLNFRNYGVAIATDPITASSSFVDAPTACSSPTSTWYIPQGQSFASATAIYSTSGGGTAPAGWYASGGIWRQWTGTTFTTNGNC